jgi:hypothetical protein
MYEAAATTCDWVSITGSLGPDQLEPIAHRSELEPFIRLGPK